VILTGHVSNGGQWQSVGEDSHKHKHFRYLELCLKLPGCRWVWMALKEVFISYFVAYFDWYSTILLMASCAEWRQEYISSLPPPADKLKAEVQRYMSDYDRKVEEVSQHTVWNVVIITADCWVQTIFIYSAVCVLCKLFCSFKLLVYSYMYTMFSCYFYALYIDSVQSSPAYCGLFYSPVDFTDASDLSTLMQINRWIKQRTHTVGWSQAHVNWERCGGKGIRHKIMGWDVGFYRSQLCGCCKPASRLFHLLTSKF